MSTHPKGGLVAGPQAVDITGADRADEEMTAETAARLRAICDALDEPFNGNLSEGQGLRRIAALEEIQSGT